MFQRIYGSLLHQFSSPHSSISKVRARHLTTGFAAPLKDYGPSTHISGNENFDWDNLGFKLMPADYMYMMTCCQGEEFKQGQLSPYGNIELSPSACVLNYGQGLLEGIKAYRADNGHLCLFRPEQNAIQMQLGAERLCMPSPSTKQFVDAVKQIALANRRWIPPAGKGSLYIRPLLIGKSPILGVAPSPEYTFLVYASPEGTAPLSLYVEEEFHQASRGGVGGVKAITNYSPVLKAQANAKNRGFSDVLYLDSNGRRSIEEASSSNIFIVKGNVISTPAPNGTILEGITRKSIIEIAKDLGYQVEERCVHVEELNDADEVFCTGTAAGVAPVLKAQANAKNRGFSDVLYLDSNGRRSIEEASSSNIFIVKGNVISTPAPNGTILEGITRKSIIEIAKDLGYQVEERCVHVEELNDADEVFCTGTAAGVAPVGSITYQSNRVKYNMDGELVSKKLYSRLVDIQRRVVEDKWGWIVEID